MLSRTCKEPVQRNEKRSAFSADTGNAEIWSRVATKKKRQRHRSVWANGVLFLSIIASTIVISSALQTRLPRHYKGRGLTKLKKSRENLIGDADDLVPSPSSLMASARDDRSGDGRRPNSPRTSGGRGKTSSADDVVSPLLLQLREQKDDVRRQLRHKNMFEAVSVVETMVESMEQYSGDGIAQRKERSRDSSDGDAENVHTAASRIFDEAVQAVTNRAFAPPYGSGLNALGRITLGLEAIDLQLSSASILSSPYGAIPRFTWLNALRALTGIAGRRAGHQRRGRQPVSSIDPASSSYRILQRLITGHGVRVPFGDLDERDFSMVLNAFIKSGRMDMAHRIVALQERTEHAPPLSPVAYSIMIKGYGRRRDAENIEMILSHAKNNAIVPDTIMYNSLIDGYVNCGMIDKAYSAFKALVDGKGIDLGDGPSPNVRTYNTMLKGFAKRGELSRALKLSHRMEAAGLWDDITTNTLVNVAVKAEEFEVAEEILNNHTGPFQNGSSRNQRSAQRRGRKHPNVEAYTEIIDGYAKAGTLDKALGTLQLMRKRGVPPNEYTYTCVIGAMARAGKVSEAKKMLAFMSSVDVPPTVITYNALITGMLAESPLDSAENNDAFVSEEQAAYNARVVDSLGLLNQMIKLSVFPDPITVSAIIEGMGRCRPARLNEARTVLRKLEKDGLVSADNERVGTALIRACAQGGDFEGSVAAFRSIANPDLVAFNAFLDSCCRCGNAKLAFDVFKKFVGRAAGTTSAAKGQALGSIKQKPDVITFTILISALLKMDTLPARKRVYRLYQEMRMWGIMPDPSLVDVILEAMTRGDPLALSKENVQFTARVLKDAEEIKWGAGELEKRKKAVRGILIYRVGEVWQGKGDERSSILPGQQTVDDPLFAMKGWNKVDSGFRLWGGVDDENRPIPEDEKNVDEFLDSHGWNDVNSGFRLF